MSAPERRDTAAGNARRAAASDLSIQADLLATSHAPPTDLIRHARELRVASLVTLHAVVREARAAGLDWAEVADALCLDEREARRISSDEEEPRLTEVGAPVADGGAALAG